MAITIFNDGDKVVASIADRNALTAKFDGMMVTVRDATADPFLGGGAAGYQWDAVNSRWALVWSDNYGTLQFATERKTIVSGQVTANNIPADGKVWQCRVIDPVTGVIMGDVRPIVNMATIEVGTVDYDGKELEFTYAYGSISTQLQVVLDAMQHQLDVATGAAIDVTQAELDAVIATVETKADAVHTHTVSQITDFDSAVNSKIQAVVGAAPEALDTLAEIAAQLGDDQDTVAALAATVAGKANAVHTHAIGDVTGLQTALDGKAASSHTHTIADVTGLQTALDGKLASTGGTATQTTLNESRVRQATSQTASSGTVTLNYANGDYFKVTASGNITLALSNMPTGAVSAIYLEATNFGGKTITFPTGIKWAGGTAPSGLTTTGIDLFVFVQDSSGVVRGFLVGKDIK